MNDAASDNLQPDEALADIVGDDPRQRAEILQDFWQYVREQGLQDSAKRVVKTDDKLKLVLGDEKTVSIFLVANLVEKHLS
jgi:chromatin remodeling complex protein RSC6